MNLENSSRPTQMMPPQRASRDTSPHSISQASQTDSPPARKGKGKSKEKKPRPKKTDVVYTRWTQSEENLLAETYVKKVFKDPGLGVDRNSRLFCIKLLVNTTAMYPTIVSRIRSQGSGHRRHTCSYGRCVKEPNELSQDDTIPHPLGKPRPSKSQKSDSSKSPGSSSKGKEAFKDMV
nr:hypothetical protein [Tanacetum cinerariifolium]